VTYTDMTYYVAITLTLWSGSAVVMEVKLHTLLTQGRGNKHYFFVVGGPYLNVSRNACCADW